MPNPIGGRRRNESTVSTDVGKIKQLEAELELLKKNYAQDMGNIGVDMIGLNEQINQLKTN